MLWKEPQASLTKTKKNATFACQKTRLQALMRYKHSTATRHKETITVPILEHNRTRLPEASERNRNFEQYPTNKDMT